LSHQLGRNSVGQLGLDSLARAATCSNLPSDVFYQWQRQFFENGTAAFESKQSRSRVSDGYQKKIEALEQKLQRKNEVRSQLVEEHTRLKKDLREA
jgi:transposase